MIENLSLKTRKAILFSSVLIITVVILFLKFSFFAKPAADIKNEKLGGDLKKFGEEASKIFREAKLQFSEIKDNAEKLMKTAATSSSPTPTETSNLNQIDIDKFKQELDEKLKEKN